MTGLGIVVIGRNEGERLTRCLEAVRLAGCPIVYVDSASTDGSVAAAGARGIPVHVLDPDRPMNAARARNEGLAWLLERQPGLRLVQFVDGDTTLDPDWLAIAAGAFSSNASLGIAAGHLGERRASLSVLHLLVALEWRRDPGETAATGGIFMARVEALAAAGGFDARIPAGEEADLCMRVHARGFTVVHLDAAMGTHDMGISGCAPGGCAACGRAMPTPRPTGRTGTGARPGAPWPGDSRSRLSCSAWPGSAGAHPCCSCWPSRRTWSASTAGRGSADGRHVNPSPTLSSPCSRSSPRRQASSPMPWTGSAERSPGW